MLFERYEDPFPYLIVRDFFDEDHFDYLHTLIDTSEFKTDPKFNKHVQTISMIPRTGKVDTKHDRSILKKNRRTSMLEPTSALLDIITSYEPFLFHMLRELAPERKLEDIICSSLDIQTVKPGYLFGAHTDALSKWLSVVVYTKEKNIGTLVGTGPVGQVREDGHEEGGRQKAFLVDEREIEWVSNTAFVFAGGVPREGVPECWHAFKANPETDKYRTTFNFNLIGDHE